MKVRIKKLHPDAIIPMYATEGASGFDLVAIEDVEIGPDCTALIRTGLSFEVPKGYELQVRPRSGLSLKTRMRVANSPGTVDADYRGEVCIIIDNIDSVCPQYGGGRIQVIKKGDRIAQGVICPVIQAELEEVTGLSDSERGSGGFGSTGV